MIPGMKPSQMPELLTRMQRMRIFVPIVEAADDGYGVRIGGPDAEDGAGFDR